MIGQCLSNTNENATVSIFQNFSEAVQEISRMIACTSQPRPIPPKSLSHMAAPSGSYGPRALRQNRPDTAELPRNGTAPVGSSRDARQETSTRRPATGRHVGHHTCATPSILSTHPCRPRHVLPSASRKPATTDVHGTTVHPCATSLWPHPHPYCGP